ncbi:Crp/Fnr family transcriptional regulator [Tabrizicola sp.]|uniref:Crp/Fnr family transcriptional regulator n=1 Tax=Tabrizicola sp. TaxID=2005166 RepID=UPI003F2DB786
MKRLDESLVMSLPPFSGLERVQVRAILDEAAAHRHEAGATVFAEGASATHFYLLLDGHVRAQRVTANGEQVILHEIPPGELFGIARALGLDAYPATAVAVSESIILAWPTRLWDDFMARFDGFARQTFRTIGLRMHDKNARIMEMATQQVEQRISNALLRLVNQSGRKTAIGIEIDFPITRQDLSEMSGTTLHTVSRVLSAWEKSGIVQSERKKITVVQPHQLVLLAQPQT